MNRALFTANLLAWYRRQHRDLPWRRTTDPYRIWVSEIMLQQTRVAAVIPYYERFLTRFPDIESLASANEQDLLSSWAGLGYYSRVRNMQRAAMTMAGRFPASWDTIRALPGIGDYTAAAVASIAFHLPYAALDGNVLRVLSRVTGDAGDIGSPLVRKRMQQQANWLLDHEEPGSFNQAMMELGATVCLPRDPQCLFCPVTDQCEARQTGRQAELPVKLRSVRKVREQRDLYLIRQGKSILLWQRPADSSRLAGFWELPERAQLSRKPAATHLLGSFRHSITYHQYTFCVHLYTPRTRMCVPCKNVVNCSWIACNSLENMALSTTARKAIALQNPGRAGR